MREVGGALELVCIDSSGCAQGCECRERTVTHADLAKWNVTTEQRFMLACEEIEFGT